MKRVNNSSNQEYALKKIRDVSLCLVIAGLVEQNFPFVDHCLDLSRSDILLTMCITRIHVLQSDSFASGAFPDTMSVPRHPSLSIGNLLKHHQSAYLS